MTGGRAAEKIETEGLDLKSKEQNRVMQRLRVAAVPEGSVHGPQCRAYRGTTDAIEQRLADLEFSLVT